MKSLLDSFEETKTGNIDVYSLKETDRTFFLTQLPDSYRISYTSICKLKAMMRKNRLTGKSCLQQFILPDISVPSIISGDFGEMLSYLLVREYQKTINIPVVGPRKWQWKGDRNKPAPHSDIVFFHVTEQFPSDNDIVISVEAKMKSGKSTKSPLQEAIHGANNDKLSRLVKTLSWFDEKLAKDGKINLRNKLKRFRSPSEFGTFKKQHKAIAIIDSELIQSELDKKLTIEHSDLQVIAVSIKQLKEAYEQIYSEISNISW